MNLSEKMHKRFLARKTVRLLCAIIFCTASIVYLSWRLTIFNQEAILVSSLFYAAEFTGFLLALAAIFSSLRHKYQPPPPTPEGLDVDVLLPVYIEPIDIIRRTIIAAVEIDYPHKTFVLDDGRRPEVQAIAEHFGCTYLSREKNLNAKAGNLNFGLEHSTADFFAVFDADHIPQPQALHLLLGFLNDPNVAFSQAPQQFYNTSGFQFVNSRRGGLWHDQSFFYNIGQPNAYSGNSVICIGTGVVYRRSAIDSIGGIPTDTVTEDLHTSLKLHKRGWKAAYCHQQVSFGLGENHLSDYYKVRLRWGHGNIHALRLENVLFCKGLTLWQRITYFVVGLNYMEGWQYLVFYLVPVFSLLTGIPPFEITLFNVLSMVFFPIFTYLLLQEFACGFGRYWVNELYAIARLPITILATFALFKNKMSWRSSSKKMATKVEWVMMLPQLSIIGLSLGALAYGIIANWAYLEAGPLIAMVLEPANIFNTNLHVEMKAGYNLDLLLMAGFWAVINIVRGGFFVRKVIKHANLSTDDYRFDVPLVFEHQLANGSNLIHQAKRISTQFVEFDKNASIKNLQSGVNCLLFLPIGAVKIKLVKVENKKNNTQTELFSLVFMDQADKAKLDRALYSITWHRKLFQSESSFTTPIQFFTNLLRMKWSVSQQKIWQSALVKDATGRKMLAFANTIKKSSIIKLVTFEKFETDENAEISLAGDKIITLKINTLKSDPETESQSTIKLLNSGHFCYEFEEMH